MAKVIAFQDKNQLIVSMSVKELINFAGFYGSEELNKLIGHTVSHYGSEISEHREKLLGVEIPVSTIYADAKETLESYSELRTKMESVRNQLTTLTKKMRPEDK